MKYLYILVLFAFNTLAIANPSDNKDPEVPKGENTLSQQHLPKMDLGILPPSESIDKKTEHDTLRARRDKEAASTQRETTPIPPISPTHPGKTKIETEEKEKSFITIPLELTSIGRAVITGNKEAYITALHDLKKGFRIDLLNIITKKTTDERNLLELMIEAPAEKEYFAREMFHSLVAITHSRKSLPSIPGSNPKLENFNLSHIFTTPIDVENLLRTAREVDNLIAYQLLMDFQNLFALFEKNSKEQIETMRELLRLSKYDTRLSSAGVSFTGAGILGILGYALLSNNPTETNTLLSLLLSREIALTDVINWDYVKIAGAGTLALGVGMTVKGIKVCQRAFRKAQQLKKIKESTTNRNIPFAD
ncbi:MAG: hypothetical protein OXM55_05285 [Bdellovibrionales bacterium]|nr:hypothetical protein [Bdellovibrionales bacterium]